MIRVVSAPWMSERARSVYLSDLERAARPARRGLVGAAAVRAWFMQAGLPIGS